MTFCLSQLPKVYPECKQSLLKDGSQWRIHLSYVAQDRPRAARGLADEFNVGRNFIINNDRVCLILGDNIFLCLTTCI